MPARDPAACSHAGRVVQKIDDDVLEQVGEAVTHMDRNTQQNAALVEQSAAAAENLKAQAQQLVQSVAVFRLG